VKTPEQNAVDRIISNLSGRKGIGDEWDCLDEDIRQEIRETLTGIVREAIVAEREARMFPIQRGPAIPWAAIAPHERQAQINHGQSLERLAQRGGLSPAEAVWVMEGRRWGSDELTPGQYTARMLELVRQALGCPRCGGSNG
jgi:hypothetical protein